MEKLLEGKIAYITGGSRGIGRAIVQLFVEQGAEVIFTATHKNSDIEQFMDKLRSIGGRVSFISYDVSNLESTKNAIDQSIKEYGRIDILVNNAGITKDTLLMRMSESDWDSVINVNLKSVFNHVKMVQPYMLKQRSGSIINLSSIVGLIGNSGQANYSASKAAIVGLTKSVARELGSRNIRCNAIAPGFIETDMTKGLSEEIRESMTKATALRRLGLPNDIANLALFLASDLSRYITAQVIRCDGGM